MNHTGISLHPGVQLGTWLRRQRRLRDLAKRVFADRISLSPARYTEVESGITHWVSDAHATAIAQTLALTGDAKKEFQELIVAARGVDTLTFDQVFSRQQLTPMRGNCQDDRPLTPEVKKRLLDQIFQPLS